MTPPPAVTAEPASGGSTAWGSYLRGALAARHDRASGGSTARAIPPDRATTSCAPAMNVVVIAIITVIVAIGIDIIGIMTINRHNK